MTPVLPPLRLGPITVDPPVVLAPMAGVTNAPFRRLCRRYGAGLYVSEMITARALIEGNAEDGADGDLRPRRAAPQPAALRHRPGRAGRGGAAAGRRGSGRPRRSQLRLPGAEGDLRGGGAALPVKRALLRAIVRRARGGRAGRGAGDDEVPHGGRRRST